MCCIFTCCGWMVDLIQRLWGFAMACCISSAVCCALIVASMAGIALGYNYSLAEYIDLKETNVTLYMRRGIFDDEIADLDWRRSGGQPIKGHIASDNLMTGAPEEEETTPLRSGRRLDDSVFESGDQNKYEGALMKLTAKAPYVSTSAPALTPDNEMMEVLKRGPEAQVLKEVQTLIDARKAMVNKLEGKVTYSPVPTYPFLEKGYQGDPSRRMIENAVVNPSQISEARKAVPGPDIGSPINWVYPHDPNYFARRYDALDLPERRITFPSPITLRATPLRPTLTERMPTDTLYLTPPRQITLFSTSSIEDSNANPLPVTEETESIQSFRDRLGLNQAVIAPRKNKPKSDEDYDYDIKGLPVRKRRSIGVNETFANDEPLEININNTTDINTTSEESPSDSTPDLYTILEEKKAVNQLSDYNKLNVFQHEAQENMNEQKEHKESTSLYLEPETDRPENQIVNDTVYFNMLNHVITKLGFIQNVLFGSNKNDQTISDLNLDSNINFSPTIHSLLVSKMVPRSSEKLTANQLINNEKLTNEEEEVIPTSSTFGKMMSLVA